MTQSTQANDDLDNNAVTPQLTPQQARVFACLVEKHLATPNNYPLTINSLMLGCNQKTNRHPVMSLTEGEIGHISNELVELGLAKIEYGERANKVTHLAMRAYELDRESAAVLCMLILREPLTLNDIKARTEKMVGFADAEAVAEVVNSLIERDRPLVVLLPKTTGRREERYTHLLCGDIDEELVTPVKTTQQSDHGKETILAQDARIEALEHRIEALEKKLQEL